MYPERVVKALQRARAHIRAGNPELALPDLEKSVQKSPKGFDAWFLLGQAQCLLNLHAQAETSFTKATVYQPQNPEVWFNLGISYSAREMFSQALPCYKKSILHASGIHVEAYHNLGSCLLSLQQHAEAAEVFRGLLRLHESADLQALLGLAQQGLEDYRAAIAAYDFAQKLGMDNYTINLNLGICHFKLENFVQAIHFTQNAIALKPGDATAEDNLARIKRAASH